MTTRRITCRYLRRAGNRCTGEVVDPDPKAIQLCTKHLAEAWLLVAEARRNKAA